MNHQKISAIRISCFLLGKYDMPQLRNKLTKYLPNINGNRDNIQKHSNLYIGLEMLNKLGLSWAKLSYSWANLIRSSVLLSCLRGRDWIFHIKLLLGLRISALISHIVGELFMVWLWVSRGLT